MIRKLLPILCILVLLSGCTTLSTYDHNLNYNDREVPITVKVGDTINISLTDRLKSHWETSVYDERVLLFKERIRWNLEEENITLNIDAFIFSAFHTGQTIINIIEYDDNQQQLDSFAVLVIVEEQ